MAITPQSTVSNKTAIDLAKVLGATPEQIAGLTSSLSSPQATKATIAAGQASPTGQIYPTSPTNLTVSAPSTISSTTTGNSSPINLPPPPTYSNPGLINTGGLINALAPTYKLNTATNMFEQVPVTDTGSAEKNEANARFQSFKDRLGLIPQKENVLQSPEILAQQAEVQKMKQEVNNYTSQLNSVIAKQNQDLLSLRETGSKEGVTEAVYGGQQATINREAAIKALPLQAAISASQGNLQLAQDYLQQLTAIKTEAVNNAYQYKMAQYEAISGFLTKEETIRMEALKEKRTQERDDRLNNISAQENWSKIALQNGQSELMVSINALDPNSPTFRSSLAAITSGIVNQGAVTEKLQQQKLQAEINKIQKENPKLDTSVVEVGGKKLLINDQTGETIKDLGTSEKGGAVSSEMILSTSKANVDSIQNILNSGGLPISVGPSTITRSQPGFFRNLIRPLGYPEQVKGIYKRLTGEQQDFIAGTEQIRSQLNLDKLIQSKAQGATFGALSDNELQVLASAGTKLGTWAIKDGDGNIVGYNVNETAFKKEMDKINNFAKLDYIIKGGDPADVNAQIMPDGTVWTTNSDGTFTQIK